ncbi:GATA transcription factor 11 [Porphyridium purpureum]|uniref:GATA transcription factor 11 n=1 Tax=Porphyridium purpureum TaxID=35688 RepID=A0A5J4YWC8_PORPP|nr:GATA transcription factor 11 [Porphyridium purpureum]|eukprot:POR3321..scf227_4
MAGQSAPAPGRTVGAVNRAVPVAAAGHAAVRECTYCSARETPLWRAGPDGPKTLCNACGVRWRKGKLTSKDGFHAPPAPQREPHTGQLQGRAQPQAPSLSTLQVVGSRPLHEEELQQNDTQTDAALRQRQHQHDAMMKKDAAQTARLAKPAGGGVSKPYKPATQHRSSRLNAMVHAKQQTAQDDASGLDWSMIYFYTDDDDDGSPALIEIKSPEDGDTYCDLDMERATEYQRESLREKVLAAHHFGVLLNAARMIE